MKKMSFAATVAVLVVAALAPIGEADAPDAVETLGPVTPVSSAPLRDLPTIASRVLPPREAPERFTRQSPDDRSGDVTVGVERDADRQARSRMPSPIVSFDGMKYANTYYVPPDPVGDVGPNHYVQMVNSAVAVYSKSGNRLSGPTSLDRMWNGTGTDCDTSDDGDPIVLYDEEANRWLISQFTAWGPQYYECIAVSKTPNPTGGWWMYAFKTSGSKFPDYPKLGVWHDAYYMTANLYGSGNSVGVYAFERAAMLAGDPARMQKVTVGGFGILPADVDGSKAPPPGEPGTFVRYINGSPDRLRIYTFEVDWATPANTTFDSRDVKVKAFDNMICPKLTVCVPQPGTAQRLDSITDLVMFRLGYRNFGSHADMVVVHTVDVNGRGAIRWYHLRKHTGGSWGVYDQGTWGSGSMWRWMPTAAMDRSGNIAVGYSVSNATSVYPGLRYAGRLAGDPKGTLGQGERVLVSGSGSQTGTNRWGDYASMSVDPEDGCTFWFTGEYQPKTGWAGWKTRIGAFRFLGCGKKLLNIRDSARLEGDAGTKTFRFTVTLATPSSKTVTVRWETRDKSALSPSDFSAGSGTLTFSPGQTSRTIQVTVKGDTKPEADEVFVVKLFHASNANIKDGLAKGRIRNDD